MTTKMPTSCSKHGDPRASLHPADFYLFIVRTLELLCDKLLGVGEGKVSDELIALKGYAQSLAMREPSDPNIVYHPDYTSLAYRGRNLSIAQLQNGLNELIEETWGRLLALTGGEKIRVEIPESMSEDLRSTDLGLSFLDRVKTEPRTLPLLSKMAKHSGTSLLRPSKRTGDHVEFEVDPGASQEFFHTIKPISEAIAFLVQTTGSGPSRLSETVDDRFRNGSSPRNLLISHGLVFLRRKNIKTSSHRGHRSSIIHFPPPKVAELIVYYLAVVRPVEIFITAGLEWDDELNAYSEFLYVVKGRKLGPRDLSDIIARYTERHFGCRLTGLDLRHVLISIQRIFLPRIPDPFAQMFGDSQAGHSSKVSAMVYGQTVNGLPGVEETLFGLSHHWCSKVHDLLGFGPEGTSFRPIPILHAPSEPTWWRPSDYIPPSPSSPAEIMSQLRTMVNSVISGAFSGFAKQCESSITEQVFRAVAAASIGVAPNRPQVVQPLPSALDDVEMEYLMGDSVSFIHSRTLHPSYPPLV